MKNQQKLSLIEILNSERPLDDQENLDSFFRDCILNFCKDSSLLTELKKDKFFFSDVIESLLGIRKKRSFYVEKKHVENVKELNEDGITIIKNFFSDQQIEKVSSFQNQCISLLGENANFGGKIDLARSINGTVYPVNTKSSIPHGELRMQSKSLGFHPPGVENLLNDAGLLSLSRSWFKNQEATIWRSTLSYLVPASQVHIPWHFDTYEDTLKVFVLLEDVNLNNGPMAYARKSNLTESSFLKNMKHKFFCSGKTDSITKRPCVGWVKNHSSDDLSSDRVLIGESEYENIKITGKRGDIAIFDVSGCHSGNIVSAAGRKVLVLSFAPSYSPLSMFFKTLSSF